jgi:hypothetical protein
VLFKYVCAGAFKSSPFEGLIKITRKKMYTLMYSFLKQHWPPGAKKGLDECLLYACKSGRYILAEDFGMSVYGQPINPVLAQTYWMHVQDPTATTIEMIWRVVFVWDEHNLSANEGNEYGSACFETSPGALACFRIIAGDLRSMFVVRNN